MIERTVDVTTADGVMPTFVFHPEHGGPHPVVLYLMDAPSIRPAFRNQASRLASAGYYVLAPYLYYRGGPYREFGATDEDMHARRDLMSLVTTTSIVPDAEALFALADGDSAAANGPAGVIGYCMTGGPAIAVARAFPDRVAACASIQGVWLVQDNPESAHLNLDRVKAEVYFLWAKGDTVAPEADIPVMMGALDAAGVTHTLDLLETPHGSIPVDSARGHDRYAAELHWERVHALLRRNL
jgi:carboxymethylenebutenolidase